MEAVPRMPMLAFELKTSPELVELGPALKSYITSAYHEDGNSYSKECSELETLRISAANVSRDFMGCSTLKRYFCQLKFLESRFPMGEGGQAAVPFTWEDSYTGRQITIADLRFEQASTLYNIGALHSVLGAMDSRQSPDGMKVSCTHFQCAAWAFQHLRDTYGSSVGIEFSHDFLTFQINLMLAQAQECILEKSMTDNRKSTITAKVAAQIVEYYRLAQSNLEASNASSIVGAKRYKEWKKRMDLRSHYHRCVMYLYMGLQAEEQQKWGERVIWFSTALDELNGSIKLAKNDDGEIDEALRFTMDVVGGKYNNAKKDNDFIYHDKIPAFDTLPEVKGASLVKGIPFNPTDPEVSGPDIFQKLVPMEAHEAASLYSEEKAKLLRQVGSQVEEKDAELDEFHASLSIDSSLLSPEPFRLPQRLLEICAALSVKPDTIQDLKKAMTSLSNVATDVGAMVQEIKTVLQADEQREKEFQEMCGKRSINTTLVDISKECTILEEQVKKGSQSDVALHKAMQNHINDLNLLALPPSELEKELPSIEETKSPEDEAILLEMKRLIAKVEEMKKQRDTVHSQLRQQVHDDDVTSAIVTRDLGDQQSFFSEQLKKHDKLIGLLNQNLSAQENILRAFVEANAKYAPIRKATTETVARREARISSLVASYEAYENLLDKSQRGIEYYKKLEEKATRLLEKAQSIIKAEEEERQMREARHKPKAASPSRPTAAKPGPGFPMAPMPEGYIPPAGGVMVSGMGVDAPEIPKAPTLKDYLPFMKPATFGPKAPLASSASAAVPGSVAGSGPTGPDHYAMYATGTSLNQIPQVPTNQGSVPSSHSSSPVHLPQQPTSQQTSPAQPAAPAATQPPASHYGMPAAAYGQHPGVSPHLARQTPSPQQMPGMQVNTIPGAQVPAMQQQQPQSVSGSPSQMPASQQPHTVPPPQQIQSTPQQYVSGTPPVQQPQQIQQQQQQQQQQQHQQQQILGSQGQQAILAGQQPHLASSQPPVAPAAQQPHLHVSVPSASPQRPGALYGQVDAPNTQMSTTPHPGSGQPQATMRDEAAHTVNMIHGSIASPEETPSSFPSGQGEAWPPGRAPTIPDVKARTLAHTTGQQQGAVQPSQQMNQYPYQQHVSSASQVPNLPTGTVAGAGHMSQVTPATQYPGYGGYMANPPSGYQAGVPSTVTGQYPAAVPGSTGGQMRPVVPSSTAAQGIQYQQGYQTTQAQSQYQQGYGNYGYPQAGTQASTTGVPPTAQRPSLPYQYNTQQPYNVQAAAGISQKAQQPQQPHGVSGYPSQQQAAATTYPKQSVAMAYPGQQAYQAPMSQGYSYPSPQTQPQQQQQQPAQTNRPASVHSYQPGQPYGQQVAAKAYNQQATGQGATGYRQPVPGSVPAQNTSSTQPGQAAYPGQVQTGAEYGQYRPTQPYGGASQYPDSRGQQVKTGYPASSTHPTTQQVPNPYSSTQGAFPTSQTQQWPQSQGNYQRPSVQQTQQAQYQYYPQQQQNQPRGVAPGSQQYQQYNQPPQQQYPGMQQQQVQSSQVGVSYTQVPATAYNQQPTTRSTVAQSHPNYSQGYAQYNQQYSQHPAQQPQHGQQPQQQQQQQQQRYASQPPNQLNINANQPQSQFMGSPLSSQVALPSPLQPSLPSPIQPNAMPQQQQQQPPPPQPAQQQQPPPAAATPIPRASSAPPDGQPAPQQLAQPIERQSSTNSSLDDILSSSPDGAVDSGGRKDAGVLTPKVITAEDRRQQREEELKKSLKQQIKMDPYEDRTTLDKFVGEVEKFEKLVEALDKHTLSGPTPLDKEWKELGEEQVKSGRQQSMGIARCYPSKNRTPDVMPYDSNRVLLKGSQNDYINASFIGDLAPCCPKFITTQSPLPVTIEDFWLMVHEQGTEVVVMLCHEGDTGVQKIYHYWPAEKNQSLQYGRFTVTLQSVKVKQFWVERILTLAHKEARQSRSVVHLQFMHWTPSGAPESPNQILSFITEVHNFYIQQRTLIRPVIVHCSDGVGRTGAFCVIYTAVQEVNQGNGVRDIDEMVRTLRERRKYMVQEKEQLAFCYRAVLYHCQSILIKRGIITNKASFGDKIPGPGEKSHQRKPSEDFILGNATSLSAIQSSVAKMTIKSETPPPTECPTGEPTVGETLPAPPQNGEAQRATLPQSTADEPGPTPDEPLVGLGTTDSGSVAVADGAERLTDSTLPGSAVVGSPVVQRSRSASGSSGLSQSSVPSGSPQHHPNMPTSLTDLQDPEKFSLDMTDSGKPKKFSKAQFHNKSKGLQEGAQDPNDPLSMLDPLWTVKDKPAS